MTGASATPSPQAPDRGPAVGVLGCVAALAEVVAFALLHLGYRSFKHCTGLGRLEIGEASVAVAVASPHRAEAFAACRFVIDTLKATVPIWKKEHFEGGAVWSVIEQGGATAHPLEPPPGRRK